MFIMCLINNMLILTRCYFSFCFNMLTNTFTMTDIDSLGLLVCPYGRPKGLTVV